MSFPAFLLAYYWPVTAAFGMDIHSLNKHVLGSFLQVPARAAAAAAVARALAGMPPHERLALPSNSEELVSIYGSRPQGQVIDDLEEEFYEKVSTTRSTLLILILNFLSWEID